MILFLHPAAKLLRAFHFYSGDLENMENSKELQCPVSRAIHFYVNNDYDLCEYMMGCNAQCLGLFISTKKCSTKTQHIMKLQCPVSRAIHFYGIPPQHQ